MPLTACRKLFPLSTRPISYLNDPEQRNNRFTQDNLLPWIEKSELAKFVTHLTAQAYNRKGRPIPTNPIMSALYPSYA